MADRKKVVPLKKFFKFYRDSHKDVKTVAEFRMILELFFLFLKEKILNDVDIIFPYRLGSLGVVAKRFRYGKDKYQISWALTKKFGKKIFCTNENTNGYKYYFLWHRNKTIKKKRPFDCYRFYAAWSMRKDLYNRITNGDEYFLKN